MECAHWKIVPLAAAGLAAACLAATAAAPAAPAGGPCLPAGVTQPPTPPGIPKLPPCKKQAPASNLRIKVDGSVTVAFALHSSRWGQCTPALGGGSHTDASTDLDFGTPTAEPVSATYRTIPKTKKKTLASLTASPDIEATLTPRQDQRHEVPPGCGVVKDPTSCSRQKGRASATVHLSDNADLARVTMHPPTLFPTQCSAPFVGDSLFDNLSFEHPLDPEDEAIMAHVANPASKIRTGTISWTNAEKPCSAYGIKKIVILDGTVEKCTVKADFRVVLSRLSTAH